MKRSYLTFLILITTGPLIFLVKTKSKLYIIEVKESVKNRRNSDSNSCKPTPSDFRGPFYVKKKFTLETSCIAFAKSSQNQGGCDDEEYRKEPIKIQGKIMDLDCKPVKGAILEYWQAAPQWSVTHKNLYTMVDSTCIGPDGAQSGNNCIDTMSSNCELAGHVPDCIIDMKYKAYRGWQKTVSGSYEINTVPPGIYPIRPIRHIHVKITVPGQKTGGKPYELITQLYLPQDKPTSEETNLFNKYIRNCEHYKVKPEQWAKKQELDVCPIRKDEEGAILTKLTTYDWDIVIDMQQY